MNKSQSKSGRCFRNLTWCALFAMALGFSPCALSGQQVVITTPLNNVRDSYYERIGMGWGYSWQGPRGNLFFQWPGLNAAPPPFGGWGGNDATFGFGWKKGRHQLNFLMAMGQGSTRTFTGVAPSVTVPNGYGGSIFSGSLRPFVTGWVPVVGQGWSVEPVIPMRPGFEGPPPRQEGTAYLSRSQQLEQLTKSELETEATEPTVAANAASKEPDLILGSPAARPATPRKDNPPPQAGDSLAAIRQQLAVQDRASLAEAYELIIEGQKAELAGKKVVAAIFYRQAANRCEGELRVQLLKRYEQLRNEKK